MMFSKKPILIVGGNGFIGSHLQDELEDEKLEILDLKRGRDVRDGISGRYRTIVFLAADMARDVSSFYYNRKLYEALDEYMQRYPRTHVIYTSSAAVYPDSEEKHSEKSLVQPVNWYGKSKLLGEAYVQQYFKHTILRLSNVYGSGGKGAYNQFTEGKTTIYGDGNDVRDYVPVDIVAVVIAEAIHRWWKFQGITNVSSGEGTTTNSLFEQHGTGKAQHVKARKGDVHCSILDNSKLQRKIRLQW